MNRFFGVVVYSITVERVIWTHFARLLVLTEVNFVRICLVCLTCRNCSISIGLTSPLTELAIELRCDAMGSGLVIRTGIGLDNVKGVLGESVDLVGNEKWWCGTCCMSLLERCHCVNRGTRFK
jgi:hypothetical protein